MTAMSAGGPAPKDTEAADWCRRVFPLVVDDTYEANRDVAITAEQFVYREAEGTEITPAIVHCEFGGLYLTADEADALAGNMRRAARLVRNR